MESAGKRSPGKLDTSKKPTPSKLINSMNEAIQKKPTTPPKPVSPHKLLKVTKVDQKEN